jgi:hypothetical protein
MPEGKSFQFPVFRVQGSRMEKEGKKLLCVFWSYMA